MARWAVERVGFQNFGEEEKGELFRVSTPLRIGVPISGRIGRTPTFRLKGCICLVLEGLFGCLGLLNEIGAEKVVFCCCKFALFEEDAKNLCCCAS